MTAPVVCCSERAASERAAVDHFTMVQVQSTFKMFASRVLVVLAYMVCVGDN